MIEIVFVLKDPTNRKVSLNRPFSDPEKEKKQMNKMIEIVFVLKDPTNRKVSLNRPFSDP